MTTNSDLSQILIEYKRMRLALEHIRDWKLPMVEFQGKMVSYESARGRNGAKDYMRQLAGDALEEL